MPRSKRKRTTDRRARINRILLALVGAVLALFAYFYATAPQGIRVDGITLCPEDASSIPHIEILLFERNRRVSMLTRQFEPISPNTVIEIRRQIEKHLTAIPKYSLVELYEVSYDSGELFESFARFCNPGDGSDISEFIGNPRLAAQRYQELFRAPFRVAIEELSEWDPKYQHSLMDSLAGITRLVLGNPQYEHTTKSLTIISDFVVPENFNLPDRIPSSFADVNSSSTLGSFEDFAEAGGLTLDFRGANVRMILNRMRYITIPDIQGPDHTAWWERFFDRQNGSVTEVIPVGEQ